MTDLDHLAAEYVLGLLEGEELLTARARIAREPDLVAAVSFWETRLAPLMDEVGAVAPDAEFWSRIEAQLSDEKPMGEVVQLKQRIRVWQRAAAGAAIAALGAVSMLILQSPASAPQLASPAVPLMANIPIADTPLRLAITILPDRSEMLVSASGLTADGVHDHELWLVPQEGAPLSLGVVKPGVEGRVELTAALANSIADGSQILLSREPIGGAPDKSAPGPLVAQGTFSKT